MVQSSHSRTRPPVPVRPSAWPRYRRLTPREKDVVGRVVAGSSNAEIARELGVSLATAKRHLANVMLKWHCANRTQVAVTALQTAGLIGGAVPASDLLSPGPRSYF